MSKINNIKIKYNTINSLLISVILTLGIITFIPIETKANNDYSYFNDYSYSLIFDSQEPLNNPKPSISSISPNNGEINNKLTITITGNGFIPSSIVRKNNSSRETTFIDSKHLLVNIYANDVYNQNEFYLTVFNNEPGGGYSNASLFTIKNSITTTNTTTTSNTTTINSNSSSNNSNYNSNSNYNNTLNTSEESNNVSSSDFNESYGSLTANALLGSNSFMPTGLLQWIGFIIMIILIIFLWRYINRSEEKYMKEPLKHA